MDELREKCIHQTIQLCSSQGLDFTMSQLAAKLGISKKTLYVLFKSKEALLLEVVNYMFDGVKASEAELLARQDLDLAEKLCRLVVVIPNTPFIPKILPTAIPMAAPMMNLETSRMPPRFSTLGISRSCRVVPKQNSCAPITAAAPALVKIAVV